MFSTPHHLPAIPFSRRPLRIALLGGILALAWFAALAPHAQQAMPVNQQLRQASESYRVKVDNGFRAVVTAERQMAASNTGGATGGTATQWRARINANQQLNLALTQLIGAHGNPGGVGTAVAGAFRELLAVDQQLANLSAQSAAATGVAARIQQALNNRAAAQARLSSNMARWNATINSVLSANLKAQRNGLTNNVDGALRELSAIDRQIAGGSTGSSSANSAAARSEQQISDLEQQNVQLNRRLSQLTRLGATKAAQNPDTGRIKTEIEQNQHTIQNLRGQAGNQARSQQQSTNRQLDYLLGQHATALDRARQGLLQVLQFDAQL